MPVTVINRPVGHKLNTTSVEGSIMDYAGDAVVYVGTGHGLSDGDYIFIESNFDTYNGFKYVDSISYDSFKIKNSEGSGYVPYKQDAEISFRVSVLDHGWQCVHLPIVYELHSDLWPINSVEDAYTPRTVSSTSNVNGYTKITGSTNWTNINALDYIELIGVGELAGIYRVLDYIDPNEAVIDLLYDAANSFSGYEIRKYYNNYFVTVNVYAGFHMTHPWYEEKPYELLATLKLTPDSQGNIKFSIAEILKGHINTRNNLTLDTLPNNLDFWTGFYISYNENYDSSDGEEITLYTTDTISDQDTFEGVAMNAIMPFKSLNQGHMSEYVGSFYQASRWLTLQERPIAVVDRFFDLSFINRHENTNVFITIFKSSNGVTTATEVIQFDNPGIGVLRVPIVPESGYDEYCVQASYEVLNQDNEILTIDILDFNLQTGSGTPWLLIGDPFVFPGPASKMLFMPFTVIEGYTYNVTTVLDVEYEDEVGATAQKVTIGFLNAALGVEVSHDDSIGGTGLVTAYNSTEGTPDSQYIFIRVTETVSSDMRDQLVSMSIEVIPPDAQDASDTTEQICIDIVSECSTTFTNDNLRLSEGGQFRELE